jgi:penicillin amidase
MATIYVAYCRLHTQAQTHATRAPPPPPLPATQASANNQVPSAAWAAQHFITADWDAGSEGYRAKRITQLLTQRRGAHDVDSISQVQLDYVSLFPRDVFDALENSGAAVAPATPGGAWLLRALRAWDGAMVVGGTLPSLWAELRRQLMALGGREVNGRVHDNAPFLLRALASDGAPGGSDPACAAAGHASCAAFAAAALDAAAAAYALDGDGEPRAGAPKLPAWGEGVHQARVAHQILDGSPLTCLADREVSHGGEDFTVNVGGWDLESGDLTQTHGPSVRHVIDMRDETLLTDGAEANATLSRWALPGGQEGDLLSPQYANLLKRWATGE